MRKIRLIAIATLLAFIMIAPVGLAMGPSGPAGKSDVGKLYLYEKNPATWEVVKGGAWGKMTYTMSGDSMWFVFNGHKLVAGTDYTLIYYPDPWPGNGLLQLGTGVADGSGDVYIEKSVDTHFDLPMVTDWNNPDNPNHAANMWPAGTVIDGAKIWLVLSGDVGTDRMTGWNPTMYLFEEQGIYVDDTYEETRLVEKTPLTVPGPWPIVTDGAWGVLTWNPDEDMFDFTFHGEKLVAGTEYALIYYPDPWPGTGLKVLGSGTADGWGCVDLSGSVNTGDMPVASDLNADPLKTTADDGSTGAKIWLVLKSDISTGEFVWPIWHPSEYLFDTGELIWFNDTDTP